MTGERFDVPDALHFPDDEFKERLAEAMTKSLCTHEHHDGHRREDTLNKNREPCPECGG